MSWPSIAGFAVGLVVGCAISIYATWRRPQPRPAATNVFAILTMTYCPGWGQHERPVAAQVSYYESGRVWRAGCPECGEGAYGATPHEAAQKWNGMAQAGFEKPA